MDNCIHVKDWIVKNGKITGLVVQWSNGRIGAVVTSRSVLLRRRYGKVGVGKVSLSAEQLEGLDQLCSYWGQVRNDWSAFFGSSAGYPHGFAGAWYYQPAGAGKKQIKIGVERLGRLDEGERLTGKDVERVPAEARSRDGAYTHICDLYRVGEKWGNKDGELVGAVFLIENLRVEARRHEMTLRTSSGWTTIEADVGWLDDKPGSEVRFIKELITLKKSEQNV